MDDNHRLYVVESEGTDPLGPYHFKAELQPPNAPDAWAIDPVLLRQSDNSLYVLWSGAGTEGHNLIYIAPMSNPWTFTGTRIALLSVRDTGNGIAAFSVDGGAETTGDYYGAIRMGEQLNYVSPELPYGQHTLRVRVTGDKDASSGAAYVSIDRAEVSAD